MPHAAVRILTRAEVNFRSYLLGRTGLQERRIDSSAWFGVQIWVNFHEVALENFAKLLKTSLTTPAVEVSLVLILRVKFLDDPCASPIVPLRRATTALASLVLSASVKL
jgi:hypothetical protein